MLGEFRNVSSDVLMPPSIKLFVRCNRHRCNRHGVFQDLLNRDRKKKHLIGWVAGALLVSSKPPNETVERFGGFRIRSAPATLDSRLRMQKTLLNGVNSAKQLQPLLPTTPSTNGEKSKTPCSCRTTILKENAAAKTNRKAVTQVVSQLPRFFSESKNSCASCEFRCHQFE